MLREGPLRLEETREMVSLRNANYKQWVKQYFEMQVRQQWLFEVRDLVLL